MDCRLGARLLQTSLDATITLGIDGSPPVNLLQGIYLLLERLKFPVYRRLFRRVQLLHAEANPAKAAQLPLGGCSSLWQPVPLTLVRSYSAVESTSKARLPRVSGQPLRSANDPSCARIRVVVLLLLC